MKQLIIIMSLSSILFGANAQKNETVQLLFPTEFRQQVENKKVQLIDVRTPNEFKSGHIKGAKNIELNSENFYAEINKLDKEKPLYVYCRSGVRSNQAAKKIADLGFKIIYDLKGGILNY